MTNMTKNEMKKWQVSILENLEEQFSRYIQGHRSNFATAFDMSEGIYNILYCMPREYSTLELSKENKKKMLAILQAFKRMEPRESSVFRCVSCDFNKYVATTYMIYKGSDLKSKCTCLSTKSRLERLMNLC